MTTNAEKQQNQITFYILPRSIRTRTKYTLVCIYQHNCIVVARTSLLSTHISGMQTVKWHFFLVVIYCFVIELIGWLKQKQQIIKLRPLCNYIPSHSQLKDWFRLSWTANAHRFIDEWQLWNHVCRRVLDGPLRSIKNPWNTKFQRNAIIWKGPHAKEEKWPSANGVLLFQWHLLIYTDVRSAAFFHVVVENASFR